MGRFSRAAALVTISLLMGGCSLLFSTDEPESEPVAESPPQPTPEPLATPQPQANPILIRPTNPEQRLRELKSGRVDPFRALVSTPATTTSATLAKADPGTTAVKTYTRPDTGSRSQASKSTPSPKRFVIPPSRSGGSDLSLPTLPQPDLARGVQVTGIVSVAGVPRAIVKAPGEAVSRSVSSGERLANGQVLVKRIDLNGSEPLVILEQYGTEVAVGVGDGSS